MILFPPIFFMYPKKVYFCILILSGYSVVRLSRLLWEQEVASSNLAIPTNNQSNYIFHVIALIA